MAILLLTIGIIFAIFLNTNNIIKGSAENSIEDINFDSPFNNTFDLGASFLVDYSTTTSLTPIGARTPDISTEDFEVTFSGFGVINHDTIMIVSGTLPFAVGYLLRNFFMCSIWHGFLHFKEEAVQSQ